MFLLRFVAILALAVWIGGWIALGGAAPVIFSVLDAHGGPAGRELAGRLFGEIFQRAQYGSWVLGLVVLLSLGARAALGPRPRRLGVRMWTATVMLAVSVATVFVIVPRIDRIRDSVAGPIANLPATDPRQITFGRLHGLSNGLMLLTILLGVGLTWAEVRDQH